MKKILAILGFLLITPLAKRPQATKENKEVFVQCMNNGECWPNDHIKGDFLEFAGAGCLEPYAESGLFAGLRCKKCVARRHPKAFLYRRSGRYRSPWAPAAKH